MSKDRAELAPTYDERRARLQELADSENVTAEQFKEFVYHIWELEGVPAEEDDYQSRYGGIELTLPNRDKPVVTIELDAPDKNWVDIVLHKDHDSEKGERVVFSEIEGVLQWRIGPHRVHSSAILGRAFSMDYENEYLSLEPLTPPDFSRLTKVIHSAYEAGREKEHMEYLKSVEGPSVWRPSDSF